MSHSVTPSIYFYCIRSNEGQINILADPISILGLCFAFLHAILKRPMKGKENTITTSKILLKNNGNAVFFKGLCLPDQLIV